MSHNQEIICIICPRGCRIHVDQSQEPWIFSGNACKRGPIYVQQELTAPTRMLTTTIAIKNAIIERLPVVTSQAIPKELIMPAIMALADLQVSTPITMGDVVLTNLLNLGIDVIATRSLEPYP